MANNGKDTGEAGNVVENISESDKLDKMLQDPEIRKLLLQKLRKKVAQPINAGRGGAVASIATGLWLSSFFRSPVFRVLAIPLFSFLLVCGVLCIVCLQYHYFIFCC